MIESDILGVAREIRCMLRAPGNHTRFQGVTVAADKMTGVMEVTTLLASGGALVRRCPHERPPSESIAHIPYTHHIHIYIRTYYTTATRYDLPTANASRRSVGASTSQALELRSARRSESMCSRAIMIQYC